MDVSRDATGSTGQLSNAGSTSGGMHHSLSTPAGVDGGARTPPATPKKGGKMLAIRVQMLDDTITIFQVQAKALGRVLFDQVCKQLHLLEADYFGLEYQDSSGTRYWLDLQKPISRQLGLSLVDPLLYFCVKFYTPDPAQLEEEYTRYLFCLQVKRDLAQGLMQCNDNTAALMASYIVQAECGDYVSEDYPDHTYLSSYKFVPHQDQEMERRIMENHKKHAGQSPAEADLNLLETARRCELYGMKMHPAKDHENVPLNLAVAHMGIVVFQHYTKINTFSWAKIRKISFKRKRFLIKLHPEGYGYYKDTVEFFFEGRNECKNFWKKCVENHGFFRCSSVKNVSRHKTRVLSRGSSFRYSGKTQKQIVEFVRDNYVKRQTFQRSASFRHSSAYSSASNMHTSTVGNSISAHPLLPLADSSLSVEASKLSASLGSMGGALGGPGSPTTRLVSRHRGTATSWSSAPDTRPTTLPAQMMSSPSPPLTTQSATPVTSATTSPQHTPYQGPETHQYTSSSPVAVHAAVHRADTGINMRTHTTSIRMPCSHKSDGNLDHSPLRLTNNYPSQTQSQNDIDIATLNQKQTSPEYTYRSITTLPKRHIWQRSASCRELYDFSFEDSGQAKRRKPNKAQEKINLDERKLESPITRYDDKRIIYSTDSRNTSLEIHQDIMMPDQKVYSSSYPGTTSYSQESVEDPGNYELRDSQDDLSHDSYELIERSDDDYSMSGDLKTTKKPVKNITTRSCSLDSGNYLPSDTESEGEKRLKCKSSSDVHADIFAMEDPRDLPREIIPRKSDGSFYKAFKTGSRTSSQESKSDYYESKSKSSKESLKKKERTVGSRTSSQESKSDYEIKKPIPRNKSFESVRKHEYVESRGSSLDSKSEYYDAVSKAIDFPKKYNHDYDRKIQFERNYGTQKPKPDFDFKETSHVHSVSLQNVETEQSLRSNRSVPNLEQNSKEPSRNVTHIWPESIAGVPTEIRETWKKSRSTESESNIFSFDEDRIQSLQESDADIAKDQRDFSVVPDIDLTTKPNQTKSKKDLFKEIFMEIEPRRLEKSLDMAPLHQPIERTKSDPNSLARQRMNSHSRRLPLMHQKTIDLTPAESSDEDYLYKQIPSAPPIMKYRTGSHFEMPAAEFGHFDILKREIEGQKTKFEVPKSQFEVLGAKTQSDFINLPPKNEIDIPYVLHKRHVMNGTASKEEKVSKLALEETQIEDAGKTTVKPLKSPKVEQVEPSGSFLFTQNIDLSKVDPVTLEIDKSITPIQHMQSPKRDITRIDPVMLEALSNKLSQIESDSPTSSRTDSLKPHPKIKPPEVVKVELKKPPVEPPKKVDQSTQKTETKELKPKASTEKKPKETKPKRIIKPRMQPGKKSGVKNKTKVRITSFSSDDESLDSDDVFGSAEATPTKLEFSPPQTRKEMESILKIESERKYLQYAMSSTEVEGSPPQTRKTDLLYDRSNDPNFQTELRRISERSFSIPSSEDELNMKTADMQPVFAEPIDPPLTPLQELEDGDKSVDDTLEDTIGEQVTVQELLHEDDLKKIAEEKEKEKELLKADIENDLKDLRVPSRTKITEISSPSLRKKGQSPLLFAHARLNLSEGSAFTLLQKQQATESPVPGRRAKSLDAPVIPVSRLPPQNAFSSKDDTVEEEDQMTQLLESSDKEHEIVRSDVDKKPSKKIIESYVVEPPRIVKEYLKEGAVKPEQKPKIPSSLDVKKAKPPPVKQKSGEKPEKDQIVPDVTQSKPKRASLAKTAQAKSTTQRSLKSKPPAHKKELPPKSGKPPIKPPLDRKPSSTPNVKTPPLRTTSKKPSAIQKSHSAERVAERAAERAVESDKETKSEKALATQSSLQLPEIKRTKSQELESTTKKPTQKEKAKSLEKLEFKRSISKERTKSQDESDSDIAKRKEKQQMLYEIAIKQTKTLKSPVKDVLPVFPQVEEMVRERHGKLEISINTIEPSVPLEEAIIITKSPKKLDKKMVDKKFTKSLELNLTGDEDLAKGLQRLGNSLDLDNRPVERSSEVFEFDFKAEAISNLTKRDEKIETSPETDGVKEEVVKAQVHKEEGSDDDTLQEAELMQDNVILEGTSLDVWLTVDEASKKVPKDKEKKVDEIQVIQKSPDFFDRPTLTKPPDLGKMEAKSSSDSQSMQSMERLSLGNSLDIKYIDDSGDSSHKSEKDAQLIAELQKSSGNIERLLLKKLHKFKPQEDLKSPEELPEDKTLVRITSEDESLTEVSDLKCESRDQDANFLAVENGHKDALLKLSIERSRSEDTGSWMTVECEEYAGTESFDSADCQDLEKISPQMNEAGLEEKKPPQEIRIDTSNLLTTETKQSKLDLLKRSSDQSRSSDTTGSWTSGENLSPGNAKENEESSVSCSMGHAIGLSQTIEMFASKDQLDNKTSPVEVDAPRSPRSPRSPRICILGRAFTIDEDTISTVCEVIPKREDESSSDGSHNEFPKDLTPIQESDANENEDFQEGGVKYKKKPYPFEEKWSNDSELSQRLHQKLSTKKQMSSSDKNSLDDSISDRKIPSRSPLHSVEKLSTESRNSMDTESSSGSLGIATRLTRSGECVKEPSSTWKPFPLESSGSSSLEEGVLPTDQDFYGQEYFLSRENSGEFAALSDITYQGPLDDLTPTADETLKADAPEKEFNYPALPGMANPDLMPGYGTSFLSRTLSRISERSTNSEKSSIDEDSTKASTQSESANESMNSSDRPGSFSSESGSNAHISDSDKKRAKSITSKISITNGNEKSSNEKKQSDKKSCEPVPSINSLLQRQISDDRRTSAEMAELSIDDIEIITSERGLRLRRQESEDTIIDEECFESEKKESSSQESDEWPLPDIPQAVTKPLMALHETPSSDTSQITTQVYQPPSKNIPKVFGLRGSLKSQDSEQWPSPPSSVTEPPMVGNVETYYMTPPEEACKVVVDSSTISTCDNDSNSDNDNKTLDFDGDKTHTYENVASTEQISESISESLSVGVSGVKIVLETKSGDSPASNSEEDLNISNLNDDVFTDTIENSSKNELRPPTVLRRSTTSDDSSHSGHDKKKLRPPSQKGSHSSYSEEECTSSLGTTLEDGTVRYALKPTKCTHSSHSEDTSIALSLSEWSNSTNTVKFQNLSSSGTTKSSTNTSGLKSDDNSLTDIAQSISEWSSSNSTLKAQSLQFQKLSSTTSTTGDNSTLTELLPTISDWSSSETSKTLVQSQFFPPSERPSISRLGSSIDDVEKCLKSPQNIPSEDIALTSLTQMKDSCKFTKCTERPMVIPVPILSDTEKSTESSSMEQKTVHTQRYDKEKQKYSQKLSTDRPVKVPLKLSKCSPYYSSSLSSESTPMQTTSPIPLSKTATVPLTRSHRKPVSKHLFQAKSPPSENDSTSSMESPKSKSDSRDRRGYRRRRQAPQKKHKIEKGVHTQDDYFYYQELEVSEYNEYIRNKSMEEVACSFHYDTNAVEGSSDNKQISGNNTILSENNNSFFTTSTPNVKNVNGTLNDSFNGNYTLNKSDDASPIRNLAKEEYMNSVNANTTINGSNTTTIIAEIEGEVKRKAKYPSDKTYYIAKEVFMTELTYKKDLDVINVWFRDEVGKEAPEECSILLSLIAPLAQAHGQLIRDLEQRMHGWEGKGGPKATSGKIGDVLLAHLPPLLPIYDEYLDGHILVLERLDAAFKQNSRFEQLYRDFETQKVCYLPVTTFVLRPLHRLLYYQNLLQRLLKHYGPNHPDRADCLTTSNTLKDLMQQIGETLAHSENLAMLYELQRDVTGFDNLVQQGRTFIRHGCLLKHSRKGYQQRMFFLFSDILLYTSRSQATFQFKVHGHMPLRGVLIEEPEGEFSSYGLIIYGGTTRALTVAANSQDEKEKWKQDLQTAMQQARDKTDTKTTYLSLKSCSSSDENVDQIGNDVGTQTKASQQRTITTVHVCWHRNTSISMKDQLIAVENQLSGYLLRKFKSSNGWQRLWVVFTSFCLFFYKSCMDDFPLASLPLLGYTIGPPSTEDGITKDFVFKLQYKNHVYFFRSESEYTYNRWLEVIGSATQLKSKKRQYENENSIEMSPEK